MRSILKSAVSMALLLGAGIPACWAQKWEFGVLGGGGFYNSASATSPAGEGDVGFKNAVALGAYLGSNMYKFVGGELRYEYLPGDLKVSSGGTSATFDGEAHAIHYDFLFHFAPTGAKVRPFVSGGGGVKIYRGTGAATVTQPLQRLALLTNTHETKGLGSVGAGIKAQAGKRFGLRFEVHDFITPFPRKVIAEAPGGKISGILHDIVVMGGIAITF
jgi:hypothetical protein